MLSVLWFAEIPVCGAAELFVGGAADKAHLSLSHLQLQDALVFGSGCRKMAHMSALLAEAGCKGSAGISIRRLLQLTAAD